MRICLPDRSGTDSYEELSGTVCRIQTILSLQNNGHRGEQ